MSSNVTTPAPPEDHEHRDPHSFCALCISRTAQSPEAIRKLLVMATEMTELFGNAADLLWQVSIPDIDLVKQLRVMFTMSAMALVVLTPDGKVTASLAAEDWDALEQIAAKGPETLRLTVERLRRGKGTTRVIVDGLPTPIPKGKH